MASGSSSSLGLSPASARVRTGGMLAVGGASAAKFGTRGAARPITVPPAVRRRLPPAASAAGPSGAAPRRAGAGAERGRLSMGSSSAMVPSGLGRSPPRASRSLSRTAPSKMARCKSRRESKVRTATPGTAGVSVHCSGTPPRSAGKILNCRPQVVQKTVVPRSEIRASSNSYSAWQRVQATSMAPAPTT